MSNSKEIIYCITIICVPLATDFYYPGKRPIVMGCDKIYLGVNMKVIRPVELEASQVKW